MLGVLFLSACVSHQTVEDYPDAWPQLQVLEAGDCVDVSGGYGFAEAEPVMDFQSRRALNALSALAGRHVAVATPNKVILSHQDDQWFRIQIFEENKLLLTKTYSKEDADLSCSQKGLFIEPPAYDQSSAAGLGRVWSDYRLLLAEDGSLVFQMHSTAAGMVMMMAPVMAKETLWSRLPKIQP